MSHAKYTGIPHPNRAGGATSAASVVGVVGFREPPVKVRLGDGGMKRFCALFNRRFDRMAMTTRPEWREFVRTEREFSKPT